MRLHKKRQVRWKNPLRHRRLVARVRAMIDADLLVFGLYTCQMHPYMLKSLTPRLLPAVTWLVYSVGGPTHPIPVYEQVTGRIPLER